MSEPKIKYPVLPARFALCEETAPARFKVDMLRHISDHGWRVQWASAHEQAWTRRLDGIKNGALVWKIEKRASKLGIVIMENVMLTKFTDGRGDHEYRLHSRDEQLSESVKLESDQFRNLVLSCYGEVPVLSVYKDRKPEPSRYADNRNADNIRDAVYKAGLSGARALLVDAKLATGLTGIVKEDTKVQALRDELKERETTETKILESYVRADPRCATLPRKGRLELDRLLVEAQKDTDDWPRQASHHCNDALMSLYYALPHPKSSNLGAYGITALQPDQSIWLAQVEAVYDPPVLKPNYKLRRDAAGKVQVQSNIRIPFEEEAFKTWLKEGGRLPTRYGTPVKIKATVTTPQGVRPAVLIRVGCHVLDVAADLGGDYEELLRPDFEINKLSDACAGVSEILGVRNETLRKEQYKRLLAFKELVGRTIVTARQAQSECRHRAKRDFKDRLSRAEELEKRLADQLAYANKLRTDLQRLREELGGPPPESFAQAVRHMLIEGTLVAPPLDQDWAGQKIDRLSCTA